MDVTKPYEFKGFGAMDVTKSYEFIGFGVPAAPAGQLGLPSGGGGGGGSHPTDRKIYLDRRSRRDSPQIGEIQIIFLYICLE